MAVSDSIVENKGDLWTLLQRQMNSAYEEVLETRRYEKGRNLVKTYIVEFSPGEHLSLDEISTDLIKDNFSFWAGRGNQKTHVTASVEKTRDDSLFRVRWNYRKKIVDAYFDVEPRRGEHRFWMIDSLSDASILESLIEKIVKQSNDVDRVWLWPEFLNAVKSKGRFRSINLAYDYRDFEEKESHQQEDRYVELGKYLKIDVRGGNEEVLHALEEILETELLGAKVVPSKIGIRYEGEEPLAERRSNIFAIEDIKYDGKMVVKGTSIDLHKELAQEIIKRYSSKVREIEKNHTITLEGKNNKIQDVLGEPLYFSFEKKPIKNLSQFCDVVFSGNYPFGLWGIPEEIDDGLLVQAVDLQTGSKMNFQIYSDLISLSLEPKACGNSVVRFFTNIQQTFSCLVIAEDSGGNAIF